MRSMSMPAKLKTAILGVEIPRPANDFTPPCAYETLLIPYPQKLEAWYIKAEKPKGTVLLFHGYCGKKSSMLSRAHAYINMGYNTLVLDFTGSGGSDGMQTTIGYKEAAQVKACYDYIKARGEQHIVLCGTSMGAVAIMKALNDDALQPSACILECPFGTMYQTTAIRFKLMKLPEYPMAPLLVFWGGLENGFWAFSHNPEQYAKQIHCPTLLIYGERDDRVTRKEIDHIYQNLSCAKQLTCYPAAGHANYLGICPDDWKRDVSSFLNGNVK